MGQGTMNATGSGILDETFAGLTKPHEVHALGRPDIVEGRPGEILADEVRRFAEAGGFDEIRGRIEKEREAADAKPIHEPLPDFAAVGPADGSRDHGLSDTDGD